MSVTKRPVEALPVLLTSFRRDVDKLLLPLPVENVSCQEEEKKAEVAAKPRQLHLTPDSFMTQSYTR